MPAALEGRVRFARRLRSNAIARKPRFLYVMTDEYSL
jgi:hypothetical protein